uniref:Uncharacterized protein n=1 Tax=Oryza meridionalis TaxID=40149 RepID=A0A0E0C4L8_9ORYZ
MEMVAVTVMTYRFQTLAVPYLVNRALLALWEKVLLAVAFAMTPLHCQKAAVVDVWHPCPHPLPPTPMQVVAQLLLPLLLPKHPLRLHLVQFGAEWEVVAMMT